jgi:hypothetical protein
VPLSAENFVQENSGTLTPAGTSCAVSLPSGTTAGNTLLVFITSVVGVTAPAGFVEDRSIIANLWAFRRSEVGASETSWTFTTSTASRFGWYVAELSGVDAVEPLDASVTSGAAFGSTSGGGTRSTGTAPLNAALDTVVLAVFSASQGNGSTESWSSYTQGFEELVDVAPGASASEGAYQLAVARKFVTGQTGTFESTATLATSQASTLTGALLVAYRAAGSPIAAPLAHLAGMEWGTHGGATSHTGSTNMLGNTLAHSGTWGTGYLVQAGSARNSSYGLQIVQAATAVAVRCGSFNAPSGSLGLNVRVVSATGTVTVAIVGTGVGAAIFYLLYDASATKFGVRAGATGTVSWESGTTALNTWRWIDLRVKSNSATWHADWRIETAADTYTDQAAAELGGQAASNWGSITFGSGSSQTVTFDVDDVVLSAYSVVYPLGPHEVRLLTVDPAGTPTVSGTSSNFSVFTANGTLAAWNAANARDALDEVPPTVSASADGVCQTAVAASDYMEFPMAAPTVAADEIVAGVRMLAAAWGGTGTGTGTLGLRGWDGTTEATLIAASTSYDAGSPTVYSTTEPRWQCAMWTPQGGWTAALLGAAALRVGFSTDATPDMGVHALYLEYATRKTVTGRMFGTDGDVTVDAATNPNTLGIRSLATATPAGGGATLHYEINANPTDVTVPPASSDTQVTDAPDAVTVNRVELRPDADPDQPG